MNATNRKYMKLVALLVAYFLLLRKVKVKHGDLKPPVSDSNPGTVFPEL
jgi:hypothetical protein